MQPDFGGDRAGRPCKSMNRGATVSGFLSIGTLYDGRDDPIGEEMEVYSDEPYLGTWTNLFDFFREFDGDKIVITVTRLP